MHGIIWLSVLKALIILITPKILYLKQIDNSNNSNNYRSYNSSGFHDPNNPANSNNPNNLANVITFTVVANP